MRFHRHSPLLWAVIALTLGVVLWAATPSRAPLLNLAADLPPGALMTLESSDFSTLLNTWMHSPEQKAWLSSASYSAFANSRLFSRLADAQSGFASAAHTDISSAFLNQIAGKESIFAWYDIGNLEFLYISHLTQEQVTALSLLQQRSKFARRESAGTAFYVRSDTRAENAAASDDIGPGVEQELTQPRTVAFAVRGEWLVLATREDLMANSLRLMASQDEAHPEPDAEANAAWYAAASGAGPRQHGDLHMLLDLQSITKTAQFRTYWIQRNVTDTRHFRAAVVDLYREPGRFREERVLLPMEPSESSPQPDLGELEALVPERIGIYRAVADPAPDDVLQTLEEKLLLAGVARDGGSGQSAPTEETEPVSGGANDLDVRIDAPQPMSGAPADALAPLRKLLEGAQIQSMLTMQRSEPVSSGDPFVRIHSAMVLRAGSPWKAQDFLEALNAALGPKLTASSLGLRWQSESSPQGSYFALTGPHYLAAFLEGPLAILSDDPALLRELLQRRGHQIPPEHARTIAAMQPGDERANFDRITRQLAQSSGAPQGETTAQDSSKPVQLFRDNLPSLAGVFRGVVRERIVVRDDGPIERQSVSYVWGTP